MTIRISPSHILYLKIKLKHPRKKLINPPVQDDLNSLYTSILRQIQNRFQNTICIENRTRMNCCLYYTSAKGIKIHIICAKINIIYIIF